MEQGFQRQLALMREDMERVAPLIYRFNSEHEGKAWIEGQTRIGSYPLCALTFTAFAVDGNGMTRRVSSFDVQYDSERMAYQRARLSDWVDFVEDSVSGEKWKEE